ncbi:cilia- and flagella-associated protein 53-like [Condylostylus longicornis]|uniref:cilia- and flagella-associated protein 53-like n=1 Tax=Condylostylus longicornis TaxID=2530218 RepID=UPI00244DFBA7|nr:cilia- and flagella-associated protein 53-like [Condylostylus longicornis]
MADILNSFHDTTYKKYLFNHIKNIVGIAKESYQKDLQKKRQRLKELLEAEDLAYENEIRIMLQGKLDEAISQRQQALLHIHNEKIHQDKEFKARKRAQQLIENSDKIRSILSEKLLKEAKACNLAQIEEKIHRKIEEDQMDLLWLNAQNNLLKMANKNQDFEDRTRKEIGLIDQNILLQQMSEKNSKYQDNKIPECQPAGTGSIFYKRPDEEDLKTIQRQKNIENQKDLLKYQALRQKLIDESLEAEKRFNEAINQYIDKALREEEEQLEAENALIENQHAEFDCKLVKEHQKYLQNHELLLRHMKDVEEKEAKRKEKCRKYGEELRAQAANHTIDAYQRILKDQEETRKFITEREVEDNIALQLLSNDEKATRTHPNWRLIDCECKKS